MYLLEEEAVKTRVQILSVLETQEYTALILSMSSVFLGCAVAWLRQ